MSDENEKPKFSLKKRENEIAQPTGPSKPCPGCRASVPEDAIICIQCGHNFTSGKKTKTSTGNASKTLKKLTLTLLILTSLAAAGYYGIKKSLPEHEGTTEKIKDAFNNAKEQVGETIENSGIKELAEEAKKAAQTTTRDFKRDILNKNVEKPVEEEASPAPAEEPDTLPDALAQKLKEKLNKKYPFAKAGEELTLKTATGETLKGQIVNIDKNAIMLHTASGAKKIPYADLHRSSRIRCDAAYRNTYLDRLIKKKQAEATTL